MPSDPPIVDPYAEDDPGADAWSPGTKADDAPAKTSSAAICSVVLALLPCLPALGGVLAILLGVMAKGDIERSAGRQGGSLLANVGIVLGSLHLAAVVVLVGGLVAHLARPAEPAPPGPPPLPALRPVPTVRTPSIPSRPHLRGGRSVPQGERVTQTQVGDITLVDVEAIKTSLGAELERQAGEAKAAGQKLIVWLVTPDCEPCDGVAAALPDPQMQEALQNVRLVRLNVRDFRVQLEHLNVPVDAVPGFALIGKDNLLVDYVHGGEWDEDIARNIAPVLGRFVRGNYGKRRYPWRGGARDDETPI